MTGFRDRAPAVTEGASTAPRVRRLIHYPVKGAAGVVTDRTVLIPMGLAHDRTFMLADHVDGTFLSQRRTPGLAVLRAAVRGDRLVLAGPDLPDLAVEIRTGGQRRAVSLFNRWFGDGVDQGDEAAEWCSALLGRKCRLVRVPPDHHRPGSGAVGGPIGFSDSTAVTVLAESTLDELNRRITERGGTPVPMERFRANIIVAGWPEPHTEDRVRRMTIGDTELAYAKRCVRCAVPLIDQRTGRRAGPEPIRTLATYRRESDGGVSFAMKAAVTRPGPLRIGTPLNVTAWASDGAR